MEKPLCISYIRFSSASQAEGTSLERQYKKALKYAEENGLVIDDKLSYRDLGKSAYSGEHIKSGQFGVFLELVRQGKIPRGSVLLVESLDRLSRQDVRSAFNQFQQIIDEGIMIVTLTDKMQYTKESIDSNFNNMLVSLSIMSRANEEMERKSQLIRDAFEIKRQNLHKEKFTANGPYWLQLNKVKQVFEVIVNRAEIVQRIFLMSYDGMGIKTITRIFNEEKIAPPRSPSGWYQSTIRKILSSRSVIGEFQPKTFNKITKKYDPVGESIPDYFPRIIDDNLFYSVQDRLNNGTHIAGRTTKIENLFSGITLCGYCGARMDIVSHPNKSGIVRYLTCDSARRGIKCSYISYNCNELEEAFLTFCNDVDILSVMNLEVTEEQKRMINLKQARSAKKGELLTIESKIQVISDQLLDGEHKNVANHFKAILDDLINKKNALLAGIEVIDRDINLMTLSIDGPKAKIESILNLVKSYKESKSEADVIQFRRRLRNEIRQIVKRILVFPRGKIYDNEQIEKWQSIAEAEINNSEKQDKNESMLLMNDDIEYMRKSQQNTKDNRYFKVIFKNGNYRYVNYSKSDKAYQVTSELTGLRYDWTLFGRKMKPMIFDDLDKDWDDNDFEIFENVEKD